MTAIPWRSARTLWRAGCDFLYPPACLLCACPIEFTEDDSGFRQRFCADCERELQSDNRDSCPRCGAPVGPYLELRERCRYCREDRFAFDSVIRFGVYAGVVQRACVAMKHRQGVPLALGLADRLWQLRSEQLAGLEAAAVLAVPRHWTAVFRREHRAAETLGRSLARRLRIPFRDDPLRKTRRTPRQSSLVPTKRRTNLRGVFSAELSADLRDKTLLLVDDVLTTGSTANEVAKVLRKAGAARIVVAVIARGLGK